MNIRSAAVNSGMSGRGVSAGGASSPAAIPNRSSWPSTFLRRDSAMLSSTFSKTWISWERRTFMESKAPLRIRFSTARLFMSVQSNIRWQKS